MVAKEKCFVSIEHGFDGSCDHWIKRAEYPCYICEPGIDECPLKKAKARAVALRNKHEEAR
ncbi:MAG: hypothetical protein GY847_14495 [Proteobacteria bacterium]|nr:hypothetical protein [Pseudomonadota bacterium]